LLSVLIVNWNTRSHLEICLKSLRAHPPQEPMEIIVVDNASTDGSAEMVARDFPEVQLIQPGFNTGYAAGNNLAFAVAQGEWLLTLNPDTELRPGVLQGAIDALRTQPNFGVLSVPFQAQFWGAECALPVAQWRDPGQRAGLPFVLGHCGAVHGVSAALAARGTRELLAPRL